MLFDTLKRKNFSVVIIISNSKMKVKFKKWRQRHNSILPIKKF